MLALSQAPPSFPSLAVPMRREPGNEASIVYTTYFSFSVSATSVECLFFFQVAPTSLTEGALAAVQKLVDLLSHFPEQCTNVYRYLLFDFRIWSRPPFSVRIGMLG